MFSFQSKKKKIPFVFDLDEDIVNLKRVDMDQNIALFQEMRDDYKNIYTINDYDLFLAGSIDTIDHHLRNSLLPNFQRQFINIIGATRFIRLQHEFKHIEEEEKVAIKLFERMISKDGDIINDLLETLKDEEFSVEFEKVSDITGLFFDGKKLSQKIANYSTPESKSESAYAITRIDALFSIVLSIASLLQT